MAYYIDYDVIYTYIARGCPGDPENLSFVPVYQGTFPGTLGNPDITCEAVNNIGRVVYTWNSEADFWSFVKNPTRIVIPFFYPDKTPDEVDHLQLVAVGDTNESSCYIQAVDANGNVVRGSEYGNIGMQGGISLGSFAYDRLCRQHTPDPLDPDIDMPIKLVMVTDPDNNNMMDFKLAGKIADENYQTNPTLSAYEYTTSIGVSSVPGEFYPWLLDGQLMDSKGIAPQGSEGGGGGFYDLPDDNMTIPALPSVSVCDTGMISLYNVTTTNLQALGNYLWNSSFVENIKKNFQDPFANIISLQLVPYAPAGTSSNIVIGNIDTGITGGKLATSYYSLDCGTIDIGEYAKMFADYAPYTKLYLNLPYCQIVELNTDDVMDGKIRVTYHIDVFSGSCVAYLLTQRKGGNWHLSGQYAGNISVQLPITGSNFASVYIGAMNSLAAVGLGIASGGMGVIAGGVAGVSGATNIKPAFNRSGGVSGTAGFLSEQYPYIIRTTPKFIVAENFRDVKGHVSNLKCNIGSCSGFLQATADNVELSGIGCTDKERDMIKNLLAEGIYIEEVQ